MKQGIWTTRVVMILLFLTVCAYFVLSAAQGLDQRWYSVTTYTHTVDDSVEATGLLVRAEEVIPGQSSAIVDVLPEQGEKVAAGETVAYLYRDESALERRREIRALQLEQDQLKYSLQQGESGWDNARLDQSIVDAMVGLKTSAAYGDLTALEDQVLTFKSLILRRMASAEGGAADISAASAALDGRIQSLQSAAALDTTPIRAGRSGSFSAVADGYESLLTPAGLESLTAGELQTLMEERPEAPAGAVGKLITDSTWYFTAVLPRAAAERMVEGRQVQVRFSRDWSGEVDMTVERVDLPEEGEALAVLSSTRFLSETSLLRKQTVDIIFQSVTGVRVPKKAVRSEWVARTDGETGEETGEQVTGVYVLTGAQAEFKEVRILADDGDYYLVEALLPQVPTNTQIKKALRAGDQVIVSSEALFDGKVMLE